MAVVRGRVVAVLRAVGEAEAGVADTLVLIRPLGRPVSLDWLPSLDAGVG